MKALVVAVGYTLLSLLAGPAFADIIPCASGNLSTIIGTTCDIGPLQFTFTALNGQIGGGTVGFAPWSASSFTLTILSNGLSTGFELSGPPPQTVASIADSVLGFEDYAQLYFQVTDLDGLINGVAISGGHLSVTGPPAFANDNVASNELQLGSYFVTDVTYGVGVAIPYYHVYGPPFSSGVGVAEPFLLYAEGGDTASIDDVATYFDFATEPLPLPPPNSIPEPSYLNPLCVGFLVFVFFSRAYVPLRSSGSQSKAYPSDHPQGGQHQPGLAFNLLMRNWMRDQR